MSVAFMYSQLPSGTPAPPQTFEITSFKRVTDTSYEVQGNLSGTIYIKNLDDNSITQVSHDFANGAYTLNHAAGERFEVSTDNTNWIAAWGVNWHEGIRAVSDNVFFDTYRPLFARAKVLERGSKYAIGRANSEAAYIYLYSNGARFYVKFPQNSYFNYKNIDLNKWVKLTHEITNNNTELIYGVDDDVSTATMDAGFTGNLDGAEPFYINGNKSWSTYSGWQLAYFTYGSKLFYFDINKMTFTDGDAIDFIMEGDISQSDLIKI